MEHKKTIVRSVIAVMLITVLSTVISFGKELVFANYYGISSITDAFSVASQLPDAIFAILSTAIGATIIPLYTQAYTDGGRQEAEDFASKYMTLLALITGTLVILGEFFAGPIISLFSPGLDHETHDIATELIRFLFPIMLVTCVVSINSGVLNANHVFGKEKATIIVRNIVYILFMILLAKAIGIWAAVFGMLIGAISELVVSGLVVRKHQSYRLRLDLKDYRILLAARRTAPVILATAIAEIQLICSKIIASYLAQGSISALSYASKLNSAITGIVLYAISSVMYPYFAEKATANDREGLGKHFSATLIAYIALFTPLTVGCIVLAEPMVTVVFKRGAFSAEDVGMVTPLFMIYSLTMIFMAVRTVGVKLFHAVGDTKTPLINSTIGVIIQTASSIGLSILLGVEGLVWSCLIANVFMAVTICFSAWKYVNKAGQADVLPVTVKVMVSSLIMGLAVYLVGMIPNLNNLLVKLVVQVLAGVVVYFAMVVVLLKRELRSILKKG